LGIQPLPPVPPSSEPVVPVIVDAKSDVLFPVEVISSVDEPVVPDDALS
jgi:hypothetical protein